MLKKRAIAITIIGLLFLVGLMGVANAAGENGTLTAQVNTITGAILNSITVLNATMSGVTGSDDNATNYTWQYSVDNGATWVTINQTNSSAQDDNVTDFNMTWDTSAIADQSDIHFNLTIVRANQENVSLTIDDLRLDNNAPTAVGCNYTGKTIIDTKTKIKLDPTDSSDVSDTSLTVNATLWLPGGNQATESIYQINDSTSTVTLSNTKVPGKYTVQCFVEDELAQKTYATNLSVTVTSADDDDSQLASAGIIEDIEEKDSGAKTFMLLASGLVVVVIAVVMVKNGPKRRRRRR